MDEKLRLLTLSIALKIADIGHSYTPFSVHERWSQCLQDEFFQQGQAELNEGREPGMLKHPEKPGVNDPGNQCGFFKVIAMPTVAAWKEVFRSSGGALVHQGQANFRQWQMRSDSRKKIP